MECKLLQTQLHCTLLQDSRQKTSFCHQRNIFWKRKGGIKKKSLNSYMLNSAACKQTYPPWEQTINMGDCGRVSHVWMDPKKVGGEGGARQTWVRPSTPDAFELGNIYPAPDSSEIRHDWRVRLRFLTVSARNQTFKLYFS